MISSLAFCSGYVPTLNNKHNLSNLKQWLFPFCYELGAWIRQVSAEWLLLFETLAEVTRDTRVAGGPVWKGHNSLTCVFSFWQGWHKIGLRWDCWMECHTWPLQHGGLRMVGTLQSSSGVLGRGLQEEETWWSKIRTHTTSTAFSCSKQHREVSQNHLERNRPCLGVEVAKNFWKC
jgi:hypothetical protein